MTKALFSLICIIFFAAHQIFGQPVVVKGIVRVGSGYIVQDASVKAKQEKKEVLTDSMGAFEIKVSPYSTVLINYKGFNEVQLKVEDDPIDTIVTLYPETSSAQPNDAAARLNTDNFQNAISSTGMSNTTVYGSSFSSSGGTLFPHFSHKEETKGNRYLFDTWVNGFVVDAQGAIVNNPDYHFNYDKMSGDLLLTQDRQSAIAIEKSQIKSFTLYDNAHNTLLFQLVPSIDGKLFVNVLSEGANYKLYKLTSTKFIKSNYRTDGMTESGNPYDEYADEQQYYILSAPGDKPETLKLSKKSIRGVLKNEGQRLDKYFSEHAADAVDEVFMKGLIDFLNK